MFKSLIIAFSTYLRIPMPSFEWKKEDMRYVMAAFPLVGALIALIQLGVYVLLERLGTGYILRAAVMTFIPLLVTGGIHMDGYMDTWDALSSYGDKEKKLAILKDPHVGAFAVIHCVCYVMLTFAFWHELAEAIDGVRAERTALYMVLAGYVLSRILSGLFAITLKKAKRDGMLNDVASDADKRCRTILIAMLTAFITAVLYFFRLSAVPMLASAALVSICYRFMSYKKFDGITGDLAGWFLQTTELAILIFAYFGR